jgi:phosphoserine phosphatase
LNARYKSVALDVDSTLSGIEGIDWLATLRDEETARSVASATLQAMSGEADFADVYGKRMQIVSPTRDELTQLSGAYRSAIAPGAKEEIDKWREAGVRVVLVSGGLRAAISPFALDLGFDEAHVSALDVEFDSTGKFTGFDRSSPLSTSMGKKTMLEKLDLPHPVLAVGDGITDVAMKEVADSFAAFIGFAIRDAVVNQADFVVDSFQELTRIILGD